MPVAQTVMDLEQSLRLCRYGRQHAASACTQDLTLMSLRRGASLKIKSAKQRDGLGAAVDRSYPEESDSVTTGDTFGLQFSHLSESVEGN